MEAIPDLLPILLTGDKKTTKACAIAIHQLVQQLEPANFVRLDEFVRQGYGNWNVRREPWYALKPPDVAHLASLGEGSVSVLGMASSHKNGYVREEAVRQLGKIVSGAELPFLFIRANDWVEEVYSTAQGLVLQRIRPDYLRPLLTWLPLALRLASAQRNDNSEIVAAIQRLFHHPEAREVLSAGLASPDKFVRRFCFEIAFNSADRDLSAIFRSAFVSGDPVVRSYAMSKLRVALPNHATKEILALARNDRSMAVRREALHIYAQQYGEEIEREFHAALLDVNAAVREEAQYYLKQKSALDLRVYYSDCLTTSTGLKLRAAISGIGETGQPTDSSLVEPFFSATSAKTRAAALRGVAKLRPDFYTEQYVLALYDPSSKVTREAALSLVKKANSIGGPRFWEIYNGCSYLHGRRAVLFLISRVTKWDSIAFLIQALADENESLAELSRDYIRRWFARYNRSSVLPSADQKARVRDALNRHGLLLNVDARREFELLLKRF